MRVGMGSAVIVLIIALVSLGFLLSDDIDTHQELTATSQRAAKLEKENQTLQEQLNIAYSKIEELNTQIRELAQQILYFQDQARQVQEQNRTLQERNAELEKQIIEISSEKIAGVHQPITDPNLMGFVLLFPVAITATYIITRYQVKAIFQKTQRTRLNNMERGTMVKLSEDEMKEVIKMRRGQ